MSWAELALGECFKIKHGYAFKGEYFSDAGQHVVLTPGNFHEPGGFRARPSKDRFYLIDPPDDFILKPNDLVIAMTEQGEGLLGSSALIPSEGSFLHNQRIGLIEELDEARLDKLFLFHLFNTPFVRGKIRASATGGKVRHTAPKRVYEIKVRVPEIREQRKIAEAISAYDGLIENNGRRIALLEEAARMLYREWFVHFRFPGHEHVKIIDGLPEGWERRALIDLAEVVMGQSPESKFYNETGDGLPFHQGVTDYGFRYVTHRTYSTAITRLGQAGDILLSVRAPVGRINLTRDNIVLGRGLSAIRSRSGHQSFLFYALKNHFYAEDIIGTGSIYAATNKKELEGQLLVLPPNALLREFEDQGSQIDRQIENVTVQVEKLAQARDLLLPRLMNGEIAV